MSDASPEFVGKQCAFEIAAYLQREHAIDLEIGAIENMAIQICDAVVAAGDRQLGALAANCSLLTTRRGPPPFGKP